MVVVAAEGASEARLKVKACGGSRACVKGAAEGGGGGGICLGRVGGQGEGVEGGGGGGSGSFRGKGEDAASDSSG